MPEPKDHLPTLLASGPTPAPATIALAHGAGAPMDSDFMNAIADGLAERGLRVIRFEFPYMAQRRSASRRRPPDRQAVLQATWNNVIRQIATRPLLIGGKSMGGRIASLVVDQADAAGLICLGYPFHPAGRHDRLRVDHLRTLRTPALIIQGERDPFGTRAEVIGYGLPSNVQLVWLPDGDHSFKPRKSSGRTLQQNMSAAVEAIAVFASQTLD